MKQILIIGAGRSASSLIRYLLEHAETEGWTIIVGDVSVELALEKTAGQKHAKAIQLDVNNDIQREGLIKQADVIISMLPAFMHFTIAKDCLKYRKHLITASYISKEIRDLHDEAKQKGVLFLNEAGLDPGIDHMSAMQIIDRMKQQGGRLISFKSYCGGLISPESNDNPWNYKFTWNPRNVILAGQGIAQYIDNGRYKYIPYNRLFSDIELISVEGYGQLEAYANRDSLAYRKVYGLQQIPTLLRGTLRNPGFCEAWNVFVRLGLTDDTYTIDDSEKLTYADWINSYLPKGTKGNTEQRLSAFLGEQETSALMQKIKWTGILENETIKIPKATPAGILQELLERKWKLKEDDIDMIVMVHKFVYEMAGLKKEIHSALIVKGENAMHTAMAKTVGLPMGIAVKLLLQNRIKERGVVVPTEKEIYEPVLKELGTYGINFIETERSLSSKE